jgi:hypothetical protein
VAVDKLAKRLGITLAEMFAELERRSDSHQAMGNR